MAGIFGEFFLVSVSHETKYENSSKNSGKIRSKIRVKFGTKIRKIRGAFVLRLFWPNDKKKTCTFKKTEMSEVILALQGYFFALEGKKQEITLEISEQLPCRSAEVKFFSVFLCQRCREI